MGNFFSGHFGGAPPLYRGRYNQRNRKKRGSSAASANGSFSLLAKGNSIRDSVMSDGSGMSLMKPSTAVASQNGSTPGTNGSIARNSKHRRSSIKMTLKRAYSSASASPNVLTDERRQIVQISWKEITDKTGKLEAALSIFQSLFEWCPELRRVFKMNSSGPGSSDIPDHFVRHAGVFANVLDLAVRNAMELETEIGPLLIMFGRRHFYKHNVQFKNQYLTLFAQSISEFIAFNLSETFLGNPEATAAWRLFVSYIIHKVKEGYDLECIQARKHPTLHF